MHQAATESTAGIPGAELTKGEITVYKGPLYLLYQDAGTTAFW